jgi:hypothetical protein
MMRTTDKMTISPLYNNTRNDITIIYDEDNDEFWSANDIAACVPGKRVDHFLANSDIKEYRAIIEQFIIPGKSGIITKRGKGGGTYFHRLIALRFAAWLSKEFEVQIYLEYDQGRKKHSDWSKERALTKYEYRLMTDAIQNNLIRSKNDTYPYAREAILINSIVFGADKFDFNPRENATIEQLDSIKSLERYNATFIEMEMNYPERKQRLIEIINKKRNKLIVDIKN